MRSIGDSSNNGQENRTTGESARSHAVDGTYQSQLLLEHINLIQEQND